MPGLKQLTLTGKYSMNLQSILTIEGLKGHPGLAVKENKQKNDNLHQKLNGS